MNEKTLAKVALRYRAIYLDIERDAIDMKSMISASVLHLVAKLKNKGFCVNEDLLHALNNVTTEKMKEIVDIFDEVMQVKLNWAPLVKGWNTPTNESVTDHFTTLIANIFGPKAGFKGTTLPCGHLIPNGTFPLERYNGCPFCGMPFVTTDFVYEGQGSKLQELRLFTKKDMQDVFISLLTSPTPLDATQKESLESLLDIFTLPDDIEIKMKETMMIVIKSLVKNGKDDEASRFFKTPTDILRYLWFEKTGYVQIIEPRTLVAHANKLYSHIWKPLNRGANAAIETKKNLMLKYDRKKCLCVAKWLNNIPLSPRQAAENMNSKRGMWVRMIRALRLGEYSRKDGLDQLAEILDIFYKQDYTTWQGSVDKARKENNADMTLKLLKERPGLFARCLFATMLRFGSEKTIAAFLDITDKLPSRLLLSLGNAAETYFNVNQERIARPITGVTVDIDPNKLLALYSEDERKAMVCAVNNIYNSAMERRFQAIENENKTIYIDPSLYNIPVSVGDRTTTIQDTSCALMGTRFPIEGNRVRLFMQWGKGLHAQHLDMDLSCSIAYPDNKTDYCSYWELHCPGAKHSGDIREIPEMVGTAEYIELYLPTLKTKGAKYVAFTCNAYSYGAISPNLVIGWMDSKNPMKISEKNGVAYDPSCVQHQVRISESNLSKGLVFGVLDVKKHEIIWLELPFRSQTADCIKSSEIEALIHRLENKISVGKLLETKAKAQNLTLVETSEEADESYTYEWALNPAEVCKLLY